MPDTRITVHYPIRSTTQSQAAQDTIEDTYNTYPYEAIELYSHIPDWKKYAIEAPIKNPSTILTHLNTHQAGIVAMSEAEFQSAGMHDPNTHNITLITRAPKQSRRFEGHIHHHTPRCARIHHVPAFHHHQLAGIGRRSRQMSLPLPGEHDGR